MPSAQEMSLLSIALETIGSIAGFESCISTVCILLEHLHSGGHIKYQPRGIKTNNSLDDERKVSRELEQV